MDEQSIAAYLRRIGVRRPALLDAAALRELHRAHQLAVPFENLSIHLSEPISLAEDDLLDKIVTRRRGGFCYELNGAFGALLRALGAEVAMAAARVYGTSGLGPPFDHLVLVVRPADGDRSWLADVGFGDDLAGVALHDRDDLLAVDRRWENLAQRPDTDPHRSRSA